jgi:hypothetical protein
MRGLISTCLLALLCADSACGSTSSSTTNSDESTSSDSGGSDESSGNLPPDTCETLELAMTGGCVLGYDIDSIEAATAICQAELGPEWSWLEFHATYGWFVQGQIKLDAWDTSTRAWVSINDQDAECFSSPTREHIEGVPEQFGMTWKPNEPNAPYCAAADCNDATGLEGPEFDPFLEEYMRSRFDDPVLVPKCNAFAGDTPCSLCRPLLCVRDIGGA